MITIWKYALEITEKQTVNLPANAQILTIQSQFDNVCLWALVDTEKKDLHSVTIEIYGTGHEIKVGVDREYISTFQLYNGKLVFHAFKISKP